MPIVVLAAILVCHTMPIVVLSAILVCYVAPQQEPESLRKQRLPMFWTQTK
jgi:hypothetical protein